MHNLILAISEKASFHCDYLVIVVMAMEERLFPEDHACQHAPQAPHIQTVVIHLKHRDDNPAITPRAINAIIHLVLPRLVN